VVTVDAAQADAVLQALQQLPPTPPPPAGPFVQQDGLVVLDDAAARVVCDPKNASAEFLEALRLIATRPDLDATDLLKVVRASTLAGHKAAASKRVRRALGGTAGTLYRVDDGGKVLVAAATRDALARALGVRPTA
jgi:hypothetical protein